MHIFLMCFYNGRNTTRSQRIAKKGLPSFRPHFFICWITLHLGEFHSAAIRKKKTKLEPEPKLCKIIELLQASFYLFFSIFENQSAAGNAIQLNKKISLTGYQFYTLSFIHTEHLPLRLRTHWWKTHTFSFHFCILQIKEKYPNGCHLKTTSQNH